MYPLAVVGDNLTARAAIRACQKSGFHDISWYPSLTENSRPAALLTGATTLPANVTRVLNALDGGAALLDLGHLPDRAQVRIGASGFLLSELPLGQFSTDRYGAPHVNIENSHLTELLPIELAATPVTDLAAVEDAHNATLICTDNSESATATHQLWHACTPLDQDSHRANITWLGRQQCAWQFATPQRTHYVFSSRIDDELVAEQWHADLTEAVSLAQPVYTFDAYTSIVREHWHAGSVAYLGDAAFAANPYLREAAALGVEDAWVISRMLENYEEDVQDGLVEYEKYRRARARRVARAAALAAEQQNRTHSIRRGLHHLNVALSTRFLPEIAMQRIDWLYSYDCIRGFR